VGQLSVPAQEPDAHRSVPVQATPSLQLPPSFAGSAWQVPLPLLQTPAWHGPFSAEQSTAVPTQAPAWHLSDVVQLLASLHVVPFGAAGFEHAPVPVSQVPATWHWSLAVHTTGFVPVQVPDWHVSVCVHALPSLHALPFAFGGFEQTPVVVLQVPTPWHWSLAVQTTGFVPVQIPT
jgi:hypothetical protein